jgi:hypothetical protein
VLGNPPWEKVKVEEHGFWALRFPGLRSLSVGEQDQRIDRLTQLRPDLAAEYSEEVARASALKRVLFAGPFPGMSTGDPDLFKAFAWRFWQLLGRGGYEGVVLPRSALSSTGTTRWRTTILHDGTFEDVTMLVNNARWVFSEVHAQYTVALVTIRKSTENRQVHFRGPFAGLDAYARGRFQPPLTFSAAELEGWTIGAAFPLLPSAQSGEVFLRLRAHPRLDDDARTWRARPIRELHATDDKGLMVFEPKSTDDLWPIYTGASFNLWNPDTGRYYAWADPEVVLQALLEKRVVQQARGRSAMGEFDSAWARDATTLPCRHPRIAFRDVARATDSRTVICCLVPPGVFLDHKAPYLLWPRGMPLDQAFLLGILSSMPLDWYARRVVETHVSFEMLNAMPVPEQDGSNRSRRVAEIAAQFAARDSRFDGWVAAVGVSTSALPDASSEPESLAELDAIVALLYRLHEKDLVHIYETFHPTWDFGARLDIALDQFRRWGKA